MLICREQDLGAQSEETLVPTIELHFEYAGVRIRASDPRERVFVADMGGLAPVERDLAFERKAKYLLESFGAVEISCLHTHEPAFDSQADYLVQGEDNVHAYCAFSSHALPQLKKLGFEVEIATDYPYQTLSGDIAWYGALSPAGSQAAAGDRSESTSDWFDLELGVEIGGARVNLLAALLDLVDNAPRAASLGRVLQSARTVALPIAEHRYLAVPREQLALILDVLRDLYSGIERDLPQPPALRREQCVDLARLRDALGKQKGPVRFHSPIVDTGAALLQEPQPQATPSALQAELRPYQAAGLAWLQQLRECSLSGVLADDMGLGKTLQTIAHITCEKQAGRLTQPALIVAPTSLVGGWSKELQRFSPSLRVRVIHGPKRRSAYKCMDEADVVITTYPLLVRDLAQFEQHQFHLVVLDEAQAIKNPRSHMHRAACSLTSNHRLCLTGTPIENNLGELWALFSFLMPNFLGSAESFRSQFRLPIEREGNAERLATLRTRISPFILRRMKDRVASELPPKTELVLPIELDGAQRDLYESIRVAAHADVRAAIRKKGLLGSTVTILDALMKLRQVCCDPRLVRVAAAAQVTRSAKYEQLLQLLERQIAAGHRILVFSQFTSMLDLIAAGVREQGVEPLILTGATQNRQRLIDRFEAGDSEVFLISLKAGGTGLNLTSADTVIHYDPWWNPAAQAQATDRAYRIGQKKPVFVHNLIVAGSVEERMLRLQEHKRQLAQSLLGQSAAADLQLSEQQVHHLFAPLPRPL
jgi:superfamily II DNA or RNA helicase